LIRDGKKFGSVIRDGKKIWIRDPEWQNSDPGSGINIPDPQHFKIGSVKKKPYFG
jgi:hypothetical protein